MYVQYSTLKNDAKKVYNLLVQTAYKLESTVDVSYLDVKTNEIQEIYDKFIADNPQIFYLGNSFLYTYDEKTNRINQQIVSFLSSIDYSSDTEALEKAIHDFLAENITYDKVVAENLNSDNIHASHSFTMYGAICDNIAVCEGYAKAFQYLCNLVGINSTPVSGVANGDKHMWNLVNINDTWYHVDVTWDSTLYKDRISYEYYNLTQSEITNLDHEIKQENLFLPK